MKELNTDKIGFYEIIDEIGRGGMGIVYHALSEDKQDVAIKICSDESEDSIKRFKREIRAISKISHKNVMPIIFADLDNIPPYYVMPLAETTVENILYELKENHDKALNVFLQICYGVQAAHLSGECHRDIKPQNALILFDGTIVVSDFGLAKFVDRDSTLLTKTAMLVGTEMYMAPEQFLPGGSREANIQTDIFQLGKTLYQIYTGQYPAVLSSDNIPANLWFIIQKATRQKPEERFSDVSELIDAVNDYIASLNPTLNPKETFLIELRNATDLLNEGKYSKSSIQKLIYILMRDEETGDSFLNLFDKVPEKILELYARVFPNDLLPLITKYANVIVSIVNTKSFDYAETVAKKMQIIYMSTGNNDLKAQAILSVLIAAVDLNRYRAMNVFNKLLLSITNDDEAYVISKILCEYIEKYASIYHQIGREQLNRFIQSIWDMAKKENMSGE